jgi:hypothetical protein
MNFRTEHPIPKFPFHIGYDDVLFLVGSCFSDHIGAYFSKYKFQSLSNPFGTLFNPKSIYNNLIRIINQESIPESTIYFFNQQYISFNHQGKYASENKQDLIEHLEHLDSIVYQHLKKTKYLFITFGTSYCYNFIEKNIIVANCHKIPGSAFKKLRLEISDIVNDYNILIDKLIEFNPSVQIIFTVSPVRHLGDGFHENQLSKSILHLAIDQINEKGNSHYFPSYELLMDDLRDYRFYNKDLCHPGENAIQYIEEMICKSFFTKETEEQMKEIEKVIKRENHKPLK